LWTNSGTVRDGPSKSSQSKSFDHARLSIFLAHHHMLTRAPNSKACHNVDLVKTAFFKVSPFRIGELSNPTITSGSQIFEGKERKENRKRRSLAQNIGTTKSP
jgi:hypothetical protein